MTWKEFKELVNSKIKDNEQIWFIDITHPNQKHECNSIVIDNQDDLGFTVSN